LITTVVPMSITYWKSTPGAMAPVLLWRPITSPMLKPAL